jgi:ribosomal protein RSM22 (predicted rRNA methylase)
LTEKIDIKKLKKASQLLSKSYRDGQTLTSKEELQAYIQVRMPATYAAIKSVLEKLPCPGSILDLGSGPGTLCQVVASLWETKHAFTAIEREKIFIEFAKKRDCRASWLHGDIFSFENFEPHDWLAFCYSLGELPEQKLPSLLQKCWHAARKGIFIVEPGTPRGFRKMLFARNFCIQLGAYVYAPCPHSHACPLSSNDWCHFSVRLERSFAHRQAKKASLPFEDEKFTYIILTKENLNHSFSRIIRAPQRLSGHTKLDLCTSEGEQKRIVSRKEKELYKKSRKLIWGDLWHGS